MVCTHNKAAAFLFSLLCTFYTSALAATLIHPPPGLGGIELSHQNATVRPNITVPNGFSRLPPDPATFEAPDVPFTVVRIHNYGASLGPAVPYTIVISRAINIAAQHSPSWHIKWSSQTYAVDNVPVQLWVNRIWGPSWFGESMTWGQWGAAAKVLLDFTRDWEFVEMSFEVVDARKKVDIAFGQLRKR